eukprot:GILJ01023612.1.p2 GENE.GILJ01023612.1~~GILJ01023612.1.p2  ORF type:complete len:213 (+),score=30.86 GILJ01023612.1:2-640(+)
MGLDWKISKIGYDEWKKQQASGVPSDNKTGDVGDERFEEWLDIDDSYAYERIGSYGNFANFRQDLLKVTLVYAKQTRQRRLVELVTSICEAQTTLFSDSKFAHFEDMFTIGMREFLRHSDSDGSLPAPICDFVLQWMSTVTDHFKVDRGPQSVVFEEDFDKQDDYTLIYGQTDKLKEQYSAVFASMIDLDILFLVMGFLRVAIRHRRPIEFV